MKQFVLKIRIIVLLTIFYTLLSGYESDIVQRKMISIPTAGNSWVINDLSKNAKIITGSGIRNWSDPETHIRTYFRVEQTGSLEIALCTKVISGTSRLSITYGGKTKKVTINNKEFDTINAGCFTVKKPGYQWIEIQGISKSETVFAEVSDILIGGKATEGKTYYAKDDFYWGRRGPSVHLRYEIPQEAGNIVWFYNELTIPEGNDVQGSYFMANGFSDGYFGIQVNSETERRVLFSVWSPFKTDNPRDIPEEYKIKMIKKGSDVLTQDFGNEGSGGQSYRKYYWKAGNTYRFLLKGEPSPNNSSDYTAYFFVPETGKWELIASFRRPKTNNYLKDLYSFLENFRPETGSVTRKGYYSNQWVCNTSGEWFELTKVKFTADATARKESRLDYAGGVENGAFFLKNCGFFNDKSDIGLNFTRERKGKIPEIDFSSFE